VRFNEILVTYGDKGLIDGVFLAIFLFVVILVS
jgi:hypothetical protein